MNLQKEHTKLADEILSNKVLSVARILNSNYELDLTYKEGKYFNIAIEAQNIEILQMLLDYFHKYQLGKYELGTTEYLLLQQKLKEILQTAVEDVELSPEIAKMLSFYINGYESDHALSDIMSDYDTDTEDQFKDLLVAGNSLTEENLQKLNEHYQYANYFNRTKNYEMSIIHQQNIIDILRFSVTENHPIMPRLLTTLANTYNAKGEPAIALKYEQEAATLKQNILNKPSTVTSSILSDLNTAFHDPQGLWKEDKALAFARREYSNRSLEVAQCYNNLGNIYEHIRSKDKTIEYRILCLELNKEILGASHPNVAACLNNLGGTYHVFGQLEKAKEYYNEALNILEKSKNKENSQTIIVFSNLINVYQVMNQHQEAIEYQKKILDIHEKLQTNSPEFAFSLNNIGNSYWALNEFDKAFDNYEKSLDQIGKILGPQHPILVNLLNIIGQKYQSVGQLKKAIEHQEQALAILKQIIPPEDQKIIAACMNNLANIYNKNNQNNDALKLQLETLKIQRELWPNGHTETAITLNNLGNTWKVLKNYKLALKNQQESVAMLENIYKGKPNQLLATCLNNLGNTYSEQGDYNNAVECQEKALKIQESSWNSDNIQTAITLNNVGSSYNAINQPEKAQEKLAQAVELLEKMSPDIKLQSILATCLNNLGNSYAAQNNHVEALECRNQALKLLEQISPEDNQLKASLLDNIGNSYTVLRNYDQALEYQEKSLDMRQAIFESAHPEIAFSLNNISNTLAALNQHDKVLEYRTKALDMLNKVFGTQDHTLLIDFLINLGNSYATLNQHERAITYQVKALEMQQRLFGDNNQKSANIAHDIGYYYTALNQHDKALEYQQQALAIFKQLGINDVVKASCLHNLGNIYSQLGDAKLALGCRKEALEIKEKIYPQNHLEIANSHNNLGISYSENGLYGKAVEYYDKALKIWQIAFIKEPDHPHIQGGLGNLERAVEYNKIEKDIQEQLLKNPQSYFIKINIQNIKIDLLKEYCQNVLKMDPPEDDDFEGVVCSISLDAKALVILHGHNKQIAGTSIVELSMEHNSDHVYQDFDLLQGTTEDIDMMGEVA